MPLCHPIRRRFVRWRPCPTTFPSNRRASSAGGPALRESSGCSRAPGPSLSLPPRDLDPAAAEPDEVLARSEAVRLFVERASQARPGFRLTTDNVEAVVHICHRLDGIPLAIELAASRMRALSIDQIES